MMFAHKVVLVDENANVLKGEFELEVSMKILINTRVNTEPVYS